MLVQILQAGIGSFLGTLGFAALIHSPRKAAVPASIVGAAAYLVYWLLMQLGLNEPVSIFAGALLGSFSAQLMARRLHIISTVFVLLSIVAAVPGLGLYRFMAMLGAGRTSGAASVGVAAMVAILMIALGIGAGSMLYRVFRRSGKHTKVTPPNAEGKP